MDGQRICNNDSFSERIGHAIIIEQSATTHTLLGATWIFHNHLRMGEDSRLYIFRGEDSMVITGLSMAETKRWQHRQSKHPIAMDPI